MKEGRIIVCILSQVAVNLLRPLISTAALAPVNLVPNVN